MTLEKDASSLAFGQAGEDRLQVVQDLPGDHEGFQDQLPQVGIHQILQLDDGPDLRHLNKVLNEEGFLILGIVGHAE